MSRRAASDRAFFGRFDQTVYCFGEEFQPLTNLTDRVVLREFHRNERRGTEAARRRNAFIFSKEIKNRKLSVIPLLLEFSNKARCVHSRAKAERHARELFYILEEDFIPLSVEFDHIKNGERWDAFDEELDKLKAKIEAQEANE